MVKPQMFTFELAHEQKIKSLFGKSLPLSKLSKNVGWYRLNSSNLGSI